MGTTDATPDQDWRVTAKQKQEERESKLPSRWKIDNPPSEDVLDVTELFAKHKWLNEEELSITALSAVELATAIKDGKYTSVAVVEAYAHRATIAQQLVNPLTEINFDVALAEAERLDKHMKQTGKVVGPLHGIPFSVKDQSDVEGLDTTMGYCSWAGRIAKEDWSVVAALKEAGAIVLTKTNAGHTLMIPETINHVWGRSVNPYNRSLTTGGSSGGEAALVGLHGSPLGFGTDIGGSVRIPAVFCGLYSLRPSHGRMSMRGVADPLKGQEAVRSTPGPMAHSPEDLELVMRTYLHSQPWRTDPAVHRLPWIPAQEPKQTLCFAIAYGDELVTPHPPTMRGLRHTAEKLKAAGHTVIEWQGSFRVKETLQLIVGLWGADGGETIKKDIEASGEPWYPVVASVIGLSPDHPTTPPSVYKTWEMQHQRTKLTEWWHDQWEATSTYTLNGQPIDGLITATLPYTAWPHRIHTGKDVPRGEHHFSSGQPLFDLSSGSFPTGLVQDPEIDLPAVDFKPKSELDARINARYNAEECRNGPIGLQITARRLEEEKVVSMLCRVRDALAK